MPNAQTVDLYLDTRLLRDFEEAVLHQRSTHTFRFDLLFNRDLLLDLAQTEEINLVCRDAITDIIKWTKSRGDFSIDDPKVGALTVPLTTDDTNIEPVLYTLGIQLRWQGRVLEWMLPRRVRVSESLL